MGGKIKNKLSYRPKYKVYSAVAYSSVDPNEHSVDVLENTIGTISFNKESTGNFSFNSNNLFIENKTFVLISSIDNLTIAALNINNTSEIFLEYTERNTNNLIDDMAGVPIEIRVYE